MKYENTPVSLPPVKIEQNQAIDMTATLFTGGTIISYDEHGQDLKIVRNGSLLVTNDRVTAVYHDASPKDVPPGTAMVDVTGKIISPGFIDTHRHMWQTGFKTLGSDSTLTEYFGRFNTSASAGSGQFTSEDVYIGQLAGLYETLNAGVTTVVDHAHGNTSTEFADAAIDASAESGARVYFGYTFHNPPRGYAVQDQIIHYINVNQSGRLKKSLVSLGVAYDAFTLASPEETSSVVQLTKSQNASFFTCHTLGGPWSFYNSPGVVDKAGLLRSPNLPCIFSHACWLTPEDATLLRETNHYISTTPESEMHWGHDHPGAKTCQDQAALGVDTHFTFSADILTQARLWLQHLRLASFSKTLAQGKVPDQTPMTVRQAFLMATRAGGLALRRPDLGVIAPGAKADLVFFDGASPSLLGWRDPVAAVILHASVGDMSDVMVEGKWVKRDGKLVVKDYEDVKARFLKSARRLQDFWENEFPRPSLKEGEKFVSGFEYGVVEKWKTERQN